MIKFSASSPEGPLYGVGLTRGNVELLMDDKPIIINMEELGGPKGKILIFYGQTEKDITVELQKAGLLPPEVDSSPLKPGEERIFNNSPDKKPKESKKPKRPKRTRK
jgi:hypothetical protein